MTPEAFEKEFVGKIICGDCLDVMKDWPDGCVDLVLFSPPYNVAKEYAGFDDEQPWPLYYKHLEQVLRGCYRCLQKGGTIAVNVPPVIKWQPDHKFAESWTGFDPAYKWHRGPERRIGKARVEPIAHKLTSIMLGIDPHIRESVVWVKGENGNAISGRYQMGCDSDPYLRGTHEVILLGSKGRWFHRGGTGRRGADAVPFMDYTKDVWFILPEHSHYHPATFPVELAERVILLFTHAVDSVVLDCYAGLGTTCIAAKKLGRRFIGIDISEEYCEIARQRLESVDTGVPVKEARKGQGALFAQP